MSAVRLLKLVSGEDLIGIVTKTEDVAIEIYQPCRMMLVANMEGMDYGLAPFMLDPDDNTIQINPAHIVYSAKPDEKIRQAYMEHIRDAWAWKSFKAQRPELQNQALTAAIDLSQTPSTTIH